MGEKLQLTHFGHAKIHKAEKFVYFLLWVPASIFPLLYLNKLSKKHQSDFIDNGYVKKSAWFSFMKDVNDYEWVFWWEYAGYFTCLFSCYSFVGVVVSKKFPTLKQSYYITASLLLLNFALSLKGVLLILFHVLLFYGVVSLKSKVVMWLWSIFCIFFVNTTNTWEQQLHAFGVYSELQNITLYSLLMTYLHLISFGCEKLNSNKKIYTFWDCLHYVFYLPLFFNGPVLTFDIFYSNVHVPKKFMWKEIGIDAVTCLLYAVGLNVFFSFNYSPALAYHYHILEEITQLEAISICWTYINVFCVKYYIFYRYSGLFAKVDGLIPPGAPKCIVSLYAFIDMWRYFDKGLNRFLQRYIYFPLGGSKHGLMKQVIASFLCFTFVGYWHGGTKSLWYWALSNWLGVVFETCILNVAQYLSFSYYLGSVMYRRLCALGGVFSVFALIYTNMIFLIGVDAANILLGRVLLNFNGCVILLALLYCCVQCSMEVNLPIAV